MVLGTVSDYAEIATDSTLTRSGLSVQQWLVKKFVDIPAPGLFGSVYDVVYAQGRFFAVGVNGDTGIIAATSLVSTVGKIPISTSWSQITGLPFEGGIRSIDFGNNLFVAVGDYGNIATSINGINWTLQYNNADYTLHKVVYAPRKGWLAVGETISATGGVVLSSPDGVTWTVGTPALDDVNYTGVPIYGVAYFRNTYVAVGGLTGVATNHIATSTDGINWVIQPTSQPLAKHSAVAYGNNRWIIGTNGTLAGALYTTSGVRSISATVWEDCAGLTGDITQVTYGNGTFVASGTNIFGSIDGRSFVTVYSSGWATSGSAGTFGNGLFVLGNLSGGLVRSNTIEELSILAPTVLTITPPQTYTITKYYQMQDSLGNTVNVPIIDLV